MPSRMGLSPRPPHGREPRCADRRNSARTVRSSNIASPTSACIALALAFALNAATLAAQDRATSQRLEELIPDSAVDDPEGWAGAPDGSDPAPDEVPDLDPASPLEELPDMAVEWPDDTELPVIEQLAPDADVEFAELETDAELLRDDSVLVQVDSQIVIGFPADASRFPLQTEFVDRFESLSALEELGEEDNIAQLAARARADEELLGELLRAYGYHDGQVIRAIGAARRCCRSAATGARLSCRRPARPAPAPRARPMRVAMRPVDAWCSRRGPPPP
ncbi:hypothetical protein J4558_01010 [Leptolyngbya sp. 15MV]|nr:hypothetical protein J4558_01010 [Leptolyngbya sp. 15MV]